LAFPFQVVKPFRFLFGRNTIKTKQDCSIWADQTNPDKTGWQKITQSLLVGTTGTTTTTTTTTATATATATTTTTTVTVSDSVPSSDQCSPTTECNSQPTTPESDNDTHSPPSTTGHTTDAAISTAATTTTTALRG
jgi:hypothetical protein